MQTTRCTEVRYFISLFSILICECDSDSDICKYLNRFSVLSKFINIVAL